MSRFPRPFLVLASAACLFPVVVCAQDNAPIETRPVQPVRGRFGAGWDFRNGSVDTSDVNLGLDNTFTAEAWFRATDLSQEHVIASQGISLSGDHWELVSERDTGFLLARISNLESPEIRSTHRVVDDQWHYVAVVRSGGAVRLFVDDELVASVEGAVIDPPVNAGEFALGMRSDEKKQTYFLIDEVRISRTARDIVARPELPFIHDDATVQLWNFEASPDEYLARWTPGGETNQRNLPYPHRIAEFEYEGEEDWIDGRWQQTQFGPFLSHSFLIDGKQMGAKLIAVFLPNRSIAVFDSRDCSVTALFSDAEVKINPSRFGLMLKPSIEGELQAYVSPRKSWLSQDPDLNEWMPSDSKNAWDYRGLRLHGNRVLFEYRIAGAMVQEFNDALPSDRRTVYLRRIRLDRVSRPLMLTLAESLPGQITVDPDGRRAVLQTESESYEWTLTTTSSAGGLVARATDLAVQFDPSDEAQDYSIVFERRPKASEIQVPDTERSDWLEQTPSIDQLSIAGTGRWGQPLVTQGVVAENGHAAYVLDEISVPFENPFKALFFISGIDFFPNGDAAVCTAHGDVWIVKGIDATLRDVRWQRFATGLYQPLGIKINEQQVVVLGRDQLTKLVDENDDGEADWYASVCHDLSTQGQDHAYAMRLESDEQGNLYFLKSSEGPPHGCSLLKLAKGNETLEVVAGGFRHPYGLGVSPRGEITVADNEGNYVPSSKIDLIEPGGFYGYYEFPDAGGEIRRPNAPLCYIPKVMDNSCGGQTWVTSRHWGNYHVGEMLHLSWGRCTLHAVLRQRVGDIWQAATVRFPEIVFRSGSGTARFHPFDGQLYVVGLDGWQTGAVQDGCMTRVRFTGNPVLMPSEFAVHTNGIRIQFSEPLSSAEALAADDFEVSHWNYLWSADYGSFHYRPSDPDSIGHDSLPVASVIRLDDQTLFLKLNEVQLVDQLQVVCRVTATSGREQAFEIFGTVKAVAPALDVQAWR